MAYKVGDKVRIVSERPDSKNYVDGMVRFLGKEITISKVCKEFGTAYYYSDDAKPKDPIQECFCKWLGVPGYFSGMNGFPALWSLRGNPAPWNSALTG